MSLEDLDTKVRQRVLRRLKIAVVLCSTFLIVEAVGGWIAGSLAILSDAAHLFSDLVAFIVAIAANHLASLPPSHQHTYGLKRIESLAALLSMMSLAMVCVWLAYEAVYRLLFPQGDIDAPLMSGIAFIGVCVNVTLALVLGEHHVHLPGADHGHDHDHDHDHGHHHHHHHDNHDGDDDDEEHQKDNHKSCSSHNHNHHHNDENGAHHEHDHNHHQHGVEEEESHSHGHHDHDDSHQHKEEESHHHDHGHCHDDDHEKLKLIGSNSENGYGSTTVTTQSSGCCEHDHDDHDDHDKPPQEKKKSLHDNVNMRAAYIHVLGDLLQSVAVLVAGLIIWLRPDWKFIDPICTLVFCLIVFYATLGIMRSAIAVLIEEIPAEISWKDMYDSISNVEGVTDVHDLHIWSISQGEPALSVHCKSVDNSTALSAINDIVKKSGIKHATVQIQPDDGPCVTCNGNGCHSGDMALEV